MLTIKKKLAPSWYKLPGEEPAAEFLLAPLTVAAFIDLRGEVRVEADGDYSISGRGIAQALTDAVRGWRNVRDESGEPAKFSLEDLLDMPPIVQERLAIEIVNRAALREVERKNSLSPSTAQ